MALSMEVIRLLCWSSPDKLEKWFNKLQTMKLGFILISLSSHGFSEHCLKKLLEAFVLWKLRVTSGTSGFLLQISTMQLHQSRVWTQKEAATSFQTRQVILCLCSWILISLWSIELHRKTSIWVYGNLWPFEGLGR